MLIFKIQCDIFFGLACVPVVFDQPKRQRGSYEKRERRGRPSQRQSTLARLPQIADLYILSFLRARLFGRLGCCRGGAC